MAADLDAVGQPATHGYFLTSALQYDRTGRDTGDALDGCSGRHTEPQGLNPRQVVVD
jgi:hypothetical protein